MASKDKEIPEEEDGVPTKASGNKKKAVVKWVGIIVGVIVLVTVSVGASIFAMKSMMSDSTVASEDAKSSDTKGKKDEKDKGKNKEPKVAIYFKLEPPFVVNFQGSGGTRFLQVSMELMSYSQEVITAIEQNMPVVKNNLVFLLSSVNYDQISTVEGKQKLREAALAEVQKVLKEKTGKTGVEEIYFTSIVMQ